MIGEPLVRVAFVDDDEDLRNSTRQTLELAGYEPLIFDRAEAALSALDETFDGVVVTDLRMPGLDGLQLFEKLNARDPTLPVLLVTGHGDVGTAVAAMRRGAYDFITKPFSTDALLASVARALDRRRAELENRRLLRQTEEAAARSALIGVSQATERLRRSIGQLAQADVDILIEGETGTGKDLVASLIHRASRRRRRPMITLDCGALPETMIESELFGHTPDAFPGARWTRIGRIEEANHGTLYLDQVELLPLAVQPKLLRACDERLVTPLGTNESKPVDFRLIVSSRDKLANRVSAGTMLDTLYYRLNAIELHLPPLRTRPEDIPVLFMHFLNQAAHAARTSTPEITDATWRRLLGHDWPGNVRELANFAKGLVLGLDERPPAGINSDVGGLTDRVGKFEAEQIRRVLAETEGNIGKTIEMLRLPRKTFYDKAKRYGIRPRAWKRKE